MTKAIIGFEVDPTEVRGTRKFNQHKPADDLAATVDGQRGAGREDIVQAIGEVRQAMNKLAVFDCDGTLVDSGGEHLRCACRTPSASMASLSRRQRSAARLSG